jgi:hypothetical protein
MAFDDASYSRDVYISMRLQLEDKVAAFLRKQILMCDELILRGG